MLLDIIKTIGVDGDVKEFLARYSGNVFAAGGAIETLRAPLHTGWLPNSIQLKVVDANDYPLDHQAVQLLTPYKEKLAGQGRETKYRIALLETIPSTPMLRIAFAPTTYEESAAFHWSLREAAKHGTRQVSILKEQWGSELIHPGRYYLPGTAVVHVIVTTIDNQVLLCRRSPNTNYHPSHWSASFEEQMNEKDLPFESAAFSSAALRGFQEELVPNHNLKPENVKMLGVFVEYGILNLEFCMQIETSLPLDEIRLFWKTEARDRWEATAVVGEPFTPENVARLLKSRTYGQTSNGIDHFHPTSKYRLILAAIHRFGWDTIVNAFE